MNSTVIQWATECLLNQGYQLSTMLPETIHDTPWSYVARFTTTAGYFYLKKTPAELSLEASISQILHDKFHASVSDVIASNADLHCFLMRDSGKPLRAVLKLHFEADLLCQAIDEFTSLQLNVADHIAIFLELGVPDWRLDKLPGLYEQLLSQRKILKADGLSESELSELHRLLPTVSNLCHKLASYPIKQTLVQCDFHDNNILIDDTLQTLTFIDLGEIVLSHPFFSLVGCLRQAKTHHALTEGDDAYQQLRQACLNNFMHLGTEAELTEAFSLAGILWFMYEALAQYRLRNACDQATFLSFQRQGKLSGALNDFITACKQYPNVFRP